MKFNIKAFIVGLTVGTLFFSTLFGVAAKSNKDSSSVVLSKSNTVVLTGEVDGESVGKVIYEAKQIDGKLRVPKESLGLIKQRPIYLFMNTPGGSIQSGLELLEALNGLDRPIHTVTMFSASMGFQIVQGLSDRLILKNGVLMSHRAAGQISGSFGGQKPSQMESRYSFWYNRLQELDQQTVKRSNGKQTLESYQKAYADELWLTGQQSLDGGYADKIVTVKCDSTLDGVTTHSVQFFGLTISYDLDNCPINTSPMNVRVASPDRDEVLSVERVEAVKIKFMEQYSARQGTVVPYRW